MPEPSHIFISAQVRFMGILNPKVSFSKRVNETFVLVNTITIFIAQCIVRTDVQARQATGFTILEMFLHHPETDAAMPTLIDSMGFFFRVIAAGVSREADCQFEVVSGLYEQILICTLQGNIGYF
jgi:hypothetical protein